MKKFAVTLIAVLAVAVLCFSFAGCGATGTYKFESLTFGGQEYKVGDEFLNRELESGSFRLVLKNDGTCVYKSTQSEKEISGTWEEKEDGKIDFSGLGITNATRDGNKITFDFLTWKITLKK